MKASIVAISGAIIPLPFAIPTTTASVPLISADDPLGKVSVVVIASAAFFHGAVPDASRLFAI